MHKNIFDYLDFAIRMAAANPNGFRKGKTSRKRKNARGASPVTFIEALAEQVYGEMV